MNPFFVVYLAIGMCILAGLLIQGRRVNGEWTTLKKEIARGTPFDPGSWRYWLEVNCLGTVAPPILVFLGILAWPALLVAQVHNFLAERARRRNETFTVRQSDLVRQMTVQEIESFEQVVDPMGAVPPVPFGFLNPAWRRFIADIEPSDRIWLFSTYWMNGWRKECRTGYVIKSGRKIRRHFIVSMHIV